MTDSHHEGPALYRFGVFELDLARRELRRQGKAVPIQSKVLNLLAYLIEHRDRAVSKEEIQEAVWTGLYVTEASLTRAVMKARRALADDSEHQAVIRTVHGHGYRFVADLDCDEEATFIGAELSVSASPVRFTKSGDVHIAWREFGARARTILLIPGFVSHLEIALEPPGMIELIEGLCAFGRVVTFDRRGVGLSDRIGYPPTAEHTGQDIAAVLDAAGADTAVLMGVSESGPASALFAAAHPERTEALIIYGSMSKGLRSDDYPWGLSDEQYAAWLDLLERDWGKPVSLEFFAPSLTHDAAFRDWWAKFLRQGSSPGTVRDVIGALRDIDVRPMLGDIRCPTLVLHRKDDRAILFGAGRNLAELIPGARLVALEGGDHLFFVGNVQAMLAAIAAFLSPARP